MIASGYLEFCVEKDSEAKLGFCGKECCDQLATSALGTRWGVAAHVPCVGHSYGQAK